MQLFVKIRQFILGPPSAERTARKLINKISLSAFRVFRDEEIRNMLLFSNLKQVEQDRIFNEFTVTGLALAILMLETASSLAEGERGDFYKEVGYCLKTRYLEWLSELGIERQYVDTWGRLIDMRCDEYRQDFYQYREHLPKPQEANPWIHVVAIGGLHHIRRGKTSPKDILFKHLLAWLKFLAIKIEKTLLQVI